MTSAFLEVLAKNRGFEWLPENYISAHKFAYNDSYELRVRMHLDPSLEVANCAKAAMSDLEFVEYSAWAVRYAGVTMLNLFSKLYDCSEYICELVNLGFYRHPVTGMRISVDDLENSGIADQIDPDSVALMAEIYAHLGEYYQNYLNALSGCGYGIAHSIVGYGNLINGYRRGGLTTNQKYKIAADSARRIAKERWRYEPVDEKDRIGSVVRDIQDYFLQNLKKYNLKDAPSDYTIKRRWLKGIIPKSAQKRGKSIRKN